MKPVKLLTILLVALSLITCSESTTNTDTNLTENTPIENTWKIVDHTYTKGGPINQTLSTYPNSKPFSLVLSTTNSFSSNGLLSNVEFFFNTHEAGTYTVKSKNTIHDNHDVKNIHIQAFISNSQGQHVTYESEDTNSTIVVEKTNGVFIITASTPITLVKTTNGGLDTPSSTTFICHKLR